MAGRIRHALGDFCRGAFSLLYWNLKKSLYRRRGGRCPCQNESDDPVPYRVRCDAVEGWREPRRFQVICPLLVSTPQGWRCSVEPAAVRPFWGRAAALLGAGFLAAWLVIATGGFVALRLVNDTPVTWTQVAWPLRWREIPSVQSRHLFQQAIASFRAGRLDEAHLRLEAARGRDPRNYEAGLLLAQIVMFQRSFLFADELFTALQAGHPEHRLTTAITYHDTLFGMDRLETLTAYCLDMASADPERAAVWMRSALLGARSLRREAAAGLNEIIGKPDRRIAPHARLLLQAELELREGRRKEALQILREPFDGPYNPFYVAYQIARLAELGAPADAQRMLDQLAPVLGPFEQLRVQAIVSFVQGDRLGTRAAFAALLKMPLSGPQAERIASFLIGHPDAQLCADLAERVKRDGGLVRTLAPAAMWVTAVACGNGSVAAEWKLRAESAGEGVLPELTAIDFTQRDVLRPDTVLHLINTVNLPREIILALLWRTAPAGEQRPRVRGG